MAEAGEPQSGPADRDDPERNGRRFGFRARFAQIARVLSPSSGVSNVPFFDEKAGYYSVRIVAEWQFAITIRSISDSKNWYPKVKCGFALVIYKVLLGSLFRSENENSLKKVVEIFGKNGRMSLYLHPLNERDG